MNNRPAPLMDRIKAAVPFFYVVDFQFTHRFQGYETASWWADHRVLPGTYPVAWRNSDGTEWDSNPDVPTPGYVVNIGPNYASVKVDTILERTHFENRLLHLVESVDEEPNRLDSLTFRAYPMSVKHNGAFLGGFFSEASVNGEVSR